MKKLTSAPKRDVRGRTEYRVSLWSFINVTIQV